MTDTISVIPEIERPPEAPAPAAPEAPGPVGGAPDSSGGGGRFGFWRRLRPTHPNGEGAGVDLRNTWQVVAGSILVPLGVVLILFAWYGSAHTPYVQQQIPYLVSGSFAGLGCMVLGGLFYWEHWLYRLFDQADQHHEEQLQVMQQALHAMVERMPTSPDGGSSHPQPGSESDRAEAGPNEVRPDGLNEGVGTVAPSAGPAVAGAGTGVPLAASYIATAAGNVYHLPSCPIIAHHAAGLRVLGAKAVAGKEPCRICLATSGR